MQCTWLQNFFQILCTQKKKKKLKSWWQNWKLNKLDCVPCSAHTGLLVKHRQSSPVENQKCYHGCAHLWAADGAVAYRGSSRKARRTQRGADDWEGWAHAADGTVHGRSDGWQGSHGGGWRGQRRRTLTWWGRGNGWAIWTTGICEDRGKYYKFI